MVRLYTGGGDEGRSKLFDGSSHAKDDAVFAALGDLDEASAALGRAHATHAALVGGAVFVPPSGNAWHRDGPDVHGKHLEWYALGNILSYCMCRLKEVASHVAMPTGPQTVWEATRFRDEAHVKQLERLIDRLQSLCPRLTKFVLPVGSALTADLHAARVVVRRAERSVVGVLQAPPVGSDKVVMRYMNRLSDALFALARYSCVAQGSVEVGYDKDVVYYMAPVVGEGD